MSKKIGIAFGLIILLTIIWNIIGQILSTLKAGDRLNEVTDKLHSLEVKNKELRGKLEEVKKPEFIESQARDKLGLVREGETLIIISQEKIEEVLGKGKEELKEKLSNWQGWLKLFWE